MERALYIAPIFVFRRPFQKASVGLPIVSCCRHTTTLSECTTLIFGLGGAGLRLRANELPVDCQRSYENVRELSIYSIENRAAECEQMIALTSLWRLQLTRGMTQYCVFILYVLSGELFVYQALPCCLLGNPTGFCPNRPLKDQPASNPSLHPAPANCTGAISNPQYRKLGIFRPKRIVATNPMVSIPHSTGEGRLIRGGHGLHQTS